MTLRDEIDALPERPKRLDWASGGSYTVAALEARLGIADRLLRAAADDVESMQHPWLLDDIYAYFAKREAE
jgi:hypothetical protein